MLFIFWGIAIIIVLEIILKLMQHHTRKKVEKERQKQEEALRQKAEEERIRFEKEQEEANKRFEEKERKIQEAISHVPGSEIYRLSEYQRNVQADTLTITEFTPISKNCFVAFDLETTGLSDSDSEIVEIGAVRVINGEITETYQQLIDPGFSIPYEATRVNHITDNMVYGKPKIYEAFPEFLTFVGDDVLAAHNAKFDIRFLAQACMRNRFACPTRFFDTMTLSRYWPEAKNKKLSTLINEAGIENNDAHRALGDAIAVAKLILATNEKRNKKTKT